MKAVTFAMLALLAAHGTAQASDAACKPVVPEPCSTVHGILRAWNGAPTFRIDIAGTRRVLGIHEENADAHPPQSVKDSLGSDAFRVKLSGDFEVCPITRAKHSATQMVCVKSAMHLTARKDDPYAR